MMIVVDVFIVLLYVAVAVLIVTIAHLLWH